MKTKLRNIIIDNSKFRYILSEKYIQKKKEFEYWESTLRIFKDGFKKHPLEIKFLSKDIYTVGNSLTSNIIDQMNLHKPRLVSQIIEYGIKEGWDWENQEMKILDGISLLEKIGYNINEIKL